MGMGEALRQRTVIIGVIIAIIVIAALIYLLVIRPPWVYP